MNRGCVRLIAATLAILILSLWIGAATLAGQEDQDQGSRIQQKMERLQTLVQQRQQEGVDLQPVGELMQEFGPLMQEGKVSEAEALLDHALDVANKLGSPPPVAVPPVLSSDAGEDKYGLIALTMKDEAGKLQIFTIRPDGSQKTQLTFKGDNGRPEWSPDGTKIVFATIRDGKGSVGVMDADGSSKKLLTDGRSPSWSKDGRRIAFARMDGQIWLMNADGGNILQITHSDTFKSGPNWSPDGRQMIFILLKNPGVKTDPQPQIGIMNSDGTNERILTTEDRSNVCKEPDGHEDFLATAHDANAPNWSPVDNRIAMWSGIERHYGEIWVINADGTGSMQVTKECSRRNNDDPSWSQDGKKILFSTGRSGRNELWVIDSDGRSEKRISNIDADPFPGRASWQPIH